MHPWHIAMPSGWGCPFHRQVDGLEQAQVSNSSTSMTEGSLLAWLDWSRSEEIMTAPDALPYSITGRDIVADADGMRVQIMTLGAGEVIPWHYHTIVTDVFVGLEGTVVIETRAPSACHELEPGKPLRRAALDRAPGLRQRRPRLPLYPGSGRRRARFQSGRQGCGAGLSQAGLFSAWSESGAEREIKLLRFPDGSGVRPDSCGNSGSPLATDGTDACLPGLSPVETYAWLKSRLEKIAAGHLQSRIHEPLPWAFQPPTGCRAQVAFRTARQSGEAPCDVPAARGDHRPDALGDQEGIGNRSGRRRPRRERNRPRRPR